MSNNKESPNSDLSRNHQRVDWWMIQVKEAMNDFLKLPTDNRLENVLDIMKQYQRGSKDGVFKLPRLS